MRYLRPALVDDARMLAVNGELPGGKDQVRRAGRRKAMGYTKGTPDMLLLWQGRAHFLELKGRENLSRNLTPEQRVFRDYCGANGFDYAVVRSLEQAREVLAGWGLLRA